MDAHSQITVLLVDDDERVHEIVGRHLRSRSQVAFRSAMGVSQAREVLRRDAADVVLVDLDMPERGELLLEDLRPEVQRGGLDVVVLTCHDESQLAIRCGQLGASAFLPKTAETYASLPGLVEAAAARVVERRQAASAPLRQQALRYADQLRRSAMPAVRAVLQAVEVAAVAGAPIVIQAPPGAQPLLLARYLHMQSPRAAGRFVHLPPEAVRDPQALGAQAAGGTLVLEELRRHSDATLVAAASLHRNGTFGLVVTAGLGDRRRAAPAGVTHVRGVPLAHRHDDWPMLLDWWNEGHGSAAPVRVSPTALEVLRRYSWPGDLDQLQQTLAALASRGGPGAEVEVRDLALALVAEYVVSCGGGLDEFDRTCLRSVLESALRLHGGRRGKAAAALSIDRKTLHRHLRRVGISGDELDDSEP